MNIEKAIKFNQVVYTQLRFEDKIVLAKAVQMGIEALKRVQDYRPERGGNDAELLPGETERE